MSHVGPMTRTVADAALMLNVTAGPDGRDQYSLPADTTDYVKALKGSMQGWRVAWCDDLGFTKALDPEVKALCATAARRFRDLGCRVETVKPKWPNPQPAWEGLFCGGIAARLGPALKTRRSDIDPNLVKLIEKRISGKPTTILTRGSRAWTGIPGSSSFLRNTPCCSPRPCPCPPFAVGLDNAKSVNGIRLAPYEWLTFTFPFNLTGNPAASIPCGFTKDGLPVGLQIVGRRFDDAGVLRASAAFEKMCPWQEARPPLTPKL